MANETVWVQGSPYRCYNVRKVSSNNLCRNIRRHLWMSPPACHFCIGINIHLSKSKELLIITTPIKLVCKTNISYIKRGGYRSLKPCRHKEKGGGKSVLQVCRNRQRCFLLGGVVLLCFDNITAIPICQPVDIQIVNIHKMQKGFRKNIVFFPNPFLPFYNSMS